MKHRAFHPAAQSHPLKATALPNFDRLARPYRTLEHLAFGSALHRARTGYLPLLAPYRHALILGDGDGRFTASLLAHNPLLHADAVDLSPAMLRALTRRAHAAHPTASTRLHTHCSDALAFTPARGSTFDLVVTHFFLDCFSDAQLLHLCRRIRPHLRAEATWLLADFRIPAGALELPARALVRTLYLGFRILTGLRTTHLPDHATAFATIGLTRTAQHLSLAGILTSELWRLPAQASRQ